MSRKIPFAFLLLGILFIAVQSGFAQVDPPLQFENNFFVTGDYVVAGAQGMTSHFVTLNGTSYAVGTITIPDANPGIHGRTSVPTGAQIVDALLYWETVELTGTIPGQSGSGQNGFFRPMFKGGPQTGYPLSGVPLPNNGQTTWSSGGCTSTSTAKFTRTYRAHVLDYLQQDANGNLIANGTYEVRLPSVGPQTPLTLGATLVIIYRVLSQNAPLNSIVIYDGAFGQNENSLIMAQTMQGFYDVANSPVSKLTHIVGSGKSDKFQTVYLNNVALPSHSGHGLPPFPGYYGTWDNPTWTFGDPNFPEIINPVHAGDASASTQVIPTPNQGGCVAWGAVIISTTVQNSDNDGLLDSWKAEQGYCDASVNEGVCNTGNLSDPAWVPLPGAKPHEQDVFVQLDFMCSSLNPNGPNGTCSSNIPYCISLNPDGTCNTAGGYSFDPRLTTDSNDGKNVIDKVVQAYEGIAPHTTHSPVVLHVIPTNAIDETDPTVTCTENPNTLPPQCPFPNQAGAVGWPAGLLVLKNQLIDQNGNAGDCAPPAVCMPRFQYGKKDSYHYALFGHALGLPSWTLLGGSLSSVVQSGHTVTFTTSTPHGLSGQNDPSCPNGRVTVAFAITNSNLNGTFCVQATGQTTFTIQVANSTSAAYTFSTDPNLAVASGQAGTISGFSDIGGENSVIALGSWGAFGVPWNAKAGTFMHELGHSNGLTHGGLFFDNLAANPNDFTPTIEANCKPNAQTVMSYLFQVDLLDVGAVSNVPDYSEQTLATLNETTPETPNFLSGATYLSTSWYDTTSHGGNSAAAHCDGTPLLNTDVPMFLTPDPPNPLKWTTQQDINFDGKFEPSLRGHDEWNGTATVPGLDLRQIGATGSLTVAGGKGFQGGGGGKGFSGGGGGIGFQGGGGGKGFSGGGGGKGFSGGGGGKGELNKDTATSVTRPPRNLTATENGSARFITLKWISPTFGEIDHYNIYRAAAGGAFNLLTSVPGVPGAQPGTAYTFQDNVQCNPGGYQYFVTAVILVGTPPKPQESVGSNIVPASGQNPLTGCYALTGGSNALSVTGFQSPASGATFTQGDPVTIAYPVTDDFYPTGGAVARTAANTTLVAIGPLPHDNLCPALASVPQFQNFPGGPGAYPQPYTILSSGGGGMTISGNQFTITWDTTNFNAGCYVIEGDFDSGQVDRTEVQVTIYESDKTPHILSTILPTATAGIPYAPPATPPSVIPPNQLQESGGTGAVTWMVIAGGTGLPLGMSLTSAGTVVGTPTTAGTYTFTVKVTDSLGNVGTRVFTLKVLIFVSYSMAPTVNSALPNATAGIPFSDTIQQFGAVGAVKWSITGGALPPGTPSSLALTTGNAGNGLLAGTPSMAGTYNFTAQATDSMGNTGSLVFTLKVLIFVSYSVAPTVNSALPNATAGIPFSDTIQQFGAVGAVTWSITGGALPPGTPSSLALTTGNAGNGLLAGTPSMAGAYNFTAQATDSAGNTGSLAFALTVLIYVSDSQPFTTMTTLPNAVVGSPYSNTVYEGGGVSNNMTAFSWTIVAGSVMPGGGSTLPGIAFQPNAVGVNNGTLSGTPTSAGTFTFTAMVMDSSGNAGTQNLTITVFAPAPAPYGLVSWYPFEGNANDLEKINNGNVLGTPQFVPGEVNNGLKPGPQLSGSLITVADSPTLALTQFTIGTWVRVDNLDNVETMQIVWKGDNTAGDLTTPYSLSVLGSANGSLSAGATVVGTAGPGKVLVILTDGTHELDLVSTNALPMDGKFHYVAVTADGQNVNLYIDGVLDPNTPTSEASLNLPFATKNPLQIGGIQGGPAPGNNFDGVIDELQIWNRALTAAEVSAIFNTVGEYQPVTRPAGLVSWWAAEGNYTDIISGNNGTPSGSVGLAPGEVGQAFSFSNATHNAEITVADNANLDVGQITIEAWVKPTTSGHGRPIVQKRSSANVGGYTLETTDTSDGPGPTNGLQFAIWISGTQYLLQTPANALTINAWQHVAATYNGSTMTIYVNGVQQGSSSVSGSIDTDSADPLVMGLNVTNASYDWNGFIDEVSLYNRALTPAEIQSIVNAGGAGKAKP